MSIIESNSYINNCKDCKKKNCNSCDVPVRISTISNKYKKEIIFQDDSFFADSDFDLDFDEIIFEEQSINERIKKWQDYYNGVNPDGTERNPFANNTQEDINIPVDQYGNTRLHIAVINNDIEEIKNIIEQGADPNIKNNATFTPYALALLDEKQEIVDFLKSCQVFA